MTSSAAWTAPGTVEVWWSSLVAAGLDVLDLLDDVERARVRSLERPADQGRSMVAAALLRVAVGAHLGVDPRDLAVDRTCADCGRPHGRPRVRGPGPVLPDVSVSHSGVLVVVAVSPRCAVGVDVQRVADLGDAPDAAHQAVQWARREAEVKAGPGPVPAVVRTIEAPRVGYAAALATRTPTPPTDADLVVRTWAGGARR